MNEKMPGFNDYKDFLTKVGHGTVDGVDVTHDGYPLSAAESKFISLFVANGKLNKCLKEAGMTMKALDGCGQFVGQFVGEHAEATARRTGIVEFRFNFTILRVDAQSDGGCVVSHLMQAGQEAFKLRERVEGQVGRARCDWVKGVFFVGGRIGVGCRSERVEGEHSLVE